MAIKKDYVNTMKERRRNKRPRYFSHNTRLGKIVNPLLEFVRYNSRFHAVLAYLTGMFIWVLILHLSEL